MNRTDEAEVERVARAIYDVTHRGLSNCYNWDDRWEDHQEARRDRYLKEAAAAIDALRATQPDAALREALRIAPIIGRGENPNAFRTRQDEWLNGPYRAALDTGAGRGEA